MANIWEIPGGRLEQGEDPILGLIREIKEETGLYVWSKLPLNIKHFKRQDNQMITMIVFLCEIKGGRLGLSEEHTEFEWTSLESAKQKLSPFFHGDIDAYSKIKNSIK